MNTIISFLDDLIFKGQIPLFRFIRIILSIVPIMALAILFDPNLGGEFAEQGWNILFITMIIRPLAETFPRLKILSRFVLLRRQMGIIAGTFILAHGLNPFIAGFTPVSIILDPKIWDFSTILPWGFLGVLICILPLLTSNDFSMRLLGKYWKLVQRLSYLFFIFGGIHIFIGKKDPLILVELISWAIIWILAQCKIAIWEEKKMPQHSQ